MNIIITHTDLDGYASEYIVRRYLESTPDNIVKFNYNYQGSTKYIEEFIDKNINIVKNIFMTDITLPGPFMEKYANLITWIDHHKSSIEEAGDWVNNLKNNFSKVKLEGYIGSDKKEADQISACELTWVSLFPNEPMPPIIFYIGRFDVWDHDSKNTTYMVMDYLNTTMAKFRHDVAVSEEFEILVESRSMSFLEEAKRIHKYKELINAANALRTVYKFNVFNKPTATFNGSCNSTYFKAVQKEHPDIEYLLSYEYKPIVKEWKIGCYSAEGKNNDALSFLNQYKEVIPDIISIGGHRGACGMTLKQNDIFKFTDTFK